MELKNKVNDIKRKIFINSKKQSFESIFGSGFLNMILMEDYSNPEVSTVISFIENTKMSKKEYRTMPSIMLNSEDNITEINASIKELIDDFFENNTINYLFSNIYNTDHEISGYVVVEKKFFLDNFYKLPLNYGFVTNVDNTKFVYYCTSKCSKKIYVYKGLIKEEKFIKILN